MRPMTRIKATTSATSVTPKTCRGRVRQRSSTHDCEQITAAPTTMVGRSSPQPRRSQAINAAIRSGAPHASRTASTTGTSRQLIPCFDSIIGTATCLERSDKRRPRTRRPTRRQKAPLRGIRRAGIESSIPAYEQGRLAQRTQAPHDAVVDTEAPAGVQPRIVTSVFHAELDPHGGCANLPVALTSKVVHRRAR